MSGLAEIDVYETEGKTWYVIGHELAIWYFESRSVLEGCYLDRNMTTRAPHWSEPLLDARCIKKYLRLHQTMQHNANVSQPIPCDNSILKALSTKAVLHTVNDKTGWVRDGCKLWLPESACYYDSLSNQLCRQHPVGKPGAGAALMSMSEKKSLMTLRLEGLTS